MLEDGKITVALLWKAHDENATSVNDLAGALDGNRFEVIFIFLGAVTSKTWMEEAGHEVYYLSDKRRLGFLNPARVLRLAKILRRHRVDVLHCHNHKANVYGTLAASLAGTPVVLAQIHGLRRARNLRRKITNLMVFRKARRILAVADAVKQDVLSSNWGVPREKLAVLENSVDYERFARSTISRSQARQMLGVPPDGVIFGTIGRLAPTKGFSYLLDAFCRVKREVPSSQLVFLGDGPSRSELEQRAAATPFREAVHFLGHRPNIEQLLRGMDVFVLSSVAEGMPRVILEAMAAGVPCVCTSVGGIPEMLDDGTLGSLVPARDSEQLAAAMVEWANRPEQERTAHVEKVREYTRRHYSHDVLTDRLAQLYEDEFAKQHSATNGGST